MTTQSPIIEIGAEITAAMIRKEYKLLETQKESTNRWWDFLREIRAQHTSSYDGLIRTVIDKYNRAGERLKAYKESFRVVTRIREYATEIGYTDRYAWEVIRKVSDITVEVRRMDATMTKRPTDFHPGGFHGHYADNYGQEHTYKSNPENKVIRLRLTKYGWKHGSRRFVMADQPYEFYDMNF